MDNRDTNQRPGWLENFLGGTPGRVIVRLIIMSLVVGFLMSVFGISPEAIFRSFQGFVNSIFDNGFEVFRDAFAYVLTGAAIVLPLWFVGRLLAAGRRR
ncbi:DUF6460 domain-containing protein [Pelagibacterium lacus]|uniref:DUF6460 domain-containing protein n=1 Tax=Pelagibacterium lacus TaxID=2282655 RepID=A0A369W6C8_9HYPH|nr:DUF6460 domain-containing protein [Pelagibacterium lacus]RDE08900.1 hypothetical protein DVH29_09110 [Pelagibacterium lacus]